MWKPRPEQAPDVEVRPISAEEIPDFLHAMSGPFAFDLPDEDEKHADLIERFSSIFEPDRTRCAFDGLVMVGTLGAFSLDLTTPGGTVPCAGTTMVTVQTSHRRQGVLRAMMLAHLDEAAERGDPIAALWASDSAIYRRYGFGVASTRADIEVDRGHIAFGRLAPDPAPIRAIGPDEASEILPAVYARISADYPGFYARSATWWTHRRLRDTPDRRDGASRYRFVVTEGPEGPSGYAQFRLKEGWEREHGHHEVRVVELIGSDGPAWSGLWRHVVSHDLAGIIKADNRSVDDPIMDLLAGPRRARTTIGDGLWVRILDVIGALESRRYRGPGSLAITVHDPQRITDGTYRLEVDETGTARCSRTDDDADIEVDVEDLGAAYLGRSRFAALGRLGRVSGSARAMRTADALCGWDVAPWCPEVF